MKVLLVSNQHPNEHGVGNPIMYRMRNALQEDERVSKVEFMPFYNNLGAIMQIRMAATDYDLVHVHFGGLYALILRFALIGIDCKKFITFHGTDIHAKQLRTTKSWKKQLKIRLNQKASFLSIRLFDRCGFVAKEMMDYVPTSLDNQMQKKSFLQPLGVDYTSFVEMDKSAARKELGKIDGKKLILFSDVSNTSIKRRDIAEGIARELGNEYELMIMCGVKPNEVPYYINACDFALLTSDEEGSPNIIREVLSLNKPFFSVEVGDAAMQLAGLQNSCIISRDTKEAAATICEYMNKEYTDNTRETLRDRLDFTRINRGVVDKYLE